MREEGFYWVKYNNDWIVAEWCIYTNNSSWLITGLETQSCDNEFDEIDEKRIVRS